MTKLFEPERQLRAALFATAAATGAPRGATATADEDDDDLVGVDELDRMLADLDAHPDEVMTYARRTWDRELAPSELRAALSALRTSIALAGDADPREIAAELPRDLRRLVGGTRAASDLTIGPTKLPADWWPERPNIGVDLDPGSFQFETDRDWTGWAWHTAGGWLGANLLKRRADFRTGDHDYSLPSRAAFKVALFSDFGTGLYHSQYIAHFIGARKPDVAVHLGDVYYAGKQEEFDHRFERVLDRHLFAQSPATKLFCLNANHEMYSRSRPYFRYVDTLRTAKRSPQEGSYFRLRLGARFQIIALDTACSMNGKIAAGRFADQPLRDWLAARLAEGRREGRSNILLTSDYPYLVGHGSKTALLRDLDPYVQQGLVDLWFWGDSHYGALFFRSEATPFVGGCLGHGGYPYYKRSPEQSAGSLAAPRFVECRARFHGTNVRPDMGNNGFAFLTLDDGDGTGEIEYIDWRDQSRCKEGLVRIPHGLDLRVPGSRSISWPSAIGEPAAARAAGPAHGRDPTQPGRQPCPCSSGGFDAGAAIRDLSRKVAALADLVAKRDAGSAPLSPLVPDDAEAAMLAPIARGAGGGAKSMAEALPMDDSARMTRALGLDWLGGIERIVGGTPVKSRNYPSCVFLAGPGRQWSCTGALIAPQVILTAAHCGDGMIEALLGGSALPELGGRDGVIAAVRNVVVHPKYGGTHGPDADRNDIAVVILDQPTSQTPVTLASDSELASASSVHLVGYGFNDEAASVGLGVLRWVEVGLGPVKTRPDQDHSAFEAEHGYTADTEFVAGRKGLGRDTCKGDSGGPAYVRVGNSTYLAGLTSRATRSATQPCGDGGIYVRPLKYVEWIARVARDHGIDLDLQTSEAART